MLSLSIRCSLSSGLISHTLAVGSQTPQASLCWDVRGAQKTHSTHRTSSRASHCVLAWLVIQEVVPGAWKLLWFCWHITTEIAQRNMVCSAHYYVRSVIKAIYNLLTVHISPGRWCHLHRVKSDTGPWIKDGSPVSINPASLSSAAPTTAGLQTQTGDAFTLWVF